MVPSPFSHTQVDRWLLVTTLVALGVAPLFVVAESTWVFFVALSFASTVGVVVLWYREVVTTSQVLWGALLLRLLYLPLLPELTDDPFRYIWDGWLQTEGINPYRYAPNDVELASFREGQLFEELNSKPYFSIYPPLSQLFFLLGGIGHDVDWRVGYYLIKVAFVGIELLGIGLLSRLVEARNVLLYAWNPLVLVEIAGQGHTEALLVPLLIGAVWAVRSGRGGVASTAVACAGLVKLYPFILLPYLVRRFGFQRILWPAALVVGGLSLPYAAAYVPAHVKESMDLFARLFEFNAGPYYLVKHVLWDLTGSDWSKVIGPTFRMVFLGSLPLLYVADWWKSWSFRRACVITIGWLFVISTTVHPWYFLPVLTLTVLHERPAWPWIWLSAVSIGTYLFYIDGPYWTWIILGWGGATLLAVWQYRRPIATSLQHVARMPVQETS